MSERPAFTVVIPTRDRSRLLREHGLRSALAQVDVTLEVIVVDDGSTDDTATAVATIDDGRVRLVRSDRPRGPSGARNAGIAEARGEWLAFLDDDDVWAPRKLRLQLEAARAAGAGWAYAGSVVVDDELRPIHLEKLPGPAEVAELLLSANVVPTGCSNVIARTALVRELGGFDEMLTSFEDWDLWIRLARASPPAVCEEIVVGRVANPSRRPPSVKAVLEQQAAVLGKHRPVTRNDHRIALEWLAYQQHGAGRRRTAASLYLRLAFSHWSLGNLVAAAGAMLGRGGMRAASRVLLATRGRSHLAEPAAAPPAPAWLSTYARPG